MTPPRPSDNASADAGAAAGALRGASTPLVEAHALGCERAGRLVVRGVAFALHPGESLLFSGPNGVGKSSLIRLIAGLLPVASGTLNVNVPVALSDENLALDTGLPLRDALGFWTRIDGASDLRLRAALEALDLMPLADIPVRMLSTGQRKRAMLVRVLASGAPLWLLDEPGNGLDGASLDRLGGAMTQHLAQGGAIIAASHFPLPLAFTSTLSLDGANA
ncbi:heme exporter protein A [Sphingobium subterraneum]|uniref:Heme exporter protein A n=2 Tax=Sphingobium subterraneum TaxID=627688 RepID=A0A841J194_9SPHN|nr:heme exporter protein A [Sphingobium subterraneum]